MTTSCHANDVAARLTGRKYLSFSAISTFQQCPLRFAFRYIQNLPEATVSASLVFGGAIHAAVQRHFDELMAGLPPPPIESLLEAYTAAWEAHAFKTVNFGKTDSRASLDTLAARMLHAFQASDLAQPAGRILGIEEELVGELVPDCPDLLARLDLVIETPDAVIVTDFKTSRSRWSNGQVTDAGAQLLLYSELARLLVPGKSVRLQFAVLTKTQNPVVEAWPLAVDSARIARTKRIFERVWEAIQAGRFYPAPSPMQCPTCPFQVQCDAWSG